MRGCRVDCEMIVVRDSGTYINPGSLGLAIDGVGRKAQFAVLTGREGTDNKAGSWEVQFLSIEYDVEGFLKDFQASGIDEIGMTLNKAVKKSYYECAAALGFGQLQTIRYVCGTANLTESSIQTAGK